VYLREDRVQSGVDFAKGHVGKDVVHGVEDHQNDHLL
jgi:hypothetical protein